MTQRRHRHDTDAGVEKPSYDYDAQWRERLQPDQSRRRNAELNSERGAGIRLGAEGRSPRQGALGRLTRAEGKRLLSPAVLLFLSVSLCTHSSLQK